LNDILQTKYFTKPNLKNFNLMLDSRLIDFNNESNHFDEFIRIKTPYFPESKKKSIKINIPIKHHKQSNKFRSNNDFNLKNSIQLNSVNGNLYFKLFWENNNIKLKSEGIIVGVDSGYKKLIITSDNKVYDDGMINIYNKINRKEQDSKSFNKSLVERDNLINQSLNKLNLSDVKELVVENLKNVKKNTKGKIRKQFNNKLQRWSYLKTLTKLECLCEESGTLFTKINPAYTSQTCSSCNTINKKNRNGEVYNCDVCGLIIDADYNASINIQQLGVYRP